MGVPTVPMVTQRFKELVATISYKKGIPNMRLVYTPHPITDRPADLCRKYVAGADPLTGQPMLEEIYAGLTKPVSAEDGKAGILKRDPRPRLLAPNTAGNLIEYFHEQGFTDGNPIILPTEERVAEMLKATSRKPDELVGQMRAAPPHEAWSYTVEMVAVNAVMAGAKPDYFPTLLAIAAKGTTSLFSSTSSFARMVVVNGPVAKETGMNSGIGALGPLNRANSTIGRCWTLISKNLGASGTIGETYLGSVGNPINYDNLCFAENEEGLPSGWNPLHVQKGFKKGDSVVSLFSGWSLSNIATYMSMPMHELIRGWLEHFFSFGMNNSTLILDPIVAADVAAKGYSTKEAFARYLADNTGTPAWVYWENHSGELKQAKEGVEPYAGWLKQGQGATIPVSRYKGARSASNFIASKGDADFVPSIEIVVTGGGTNTFWAGGDFSYVGSSSVDKWR
jgi:hypothetical protein